MKDYYRILGVNENATLDEIKTAFRVHSKKYHPDNFVNADDTTKIEAEKKFKEILEAYTQIKNAPSLANTPSKFTSTDNYAENNQNSSNYYTDETDYEATLEKQKAFDDFQKIYQNFKKELDKNRLPFEKELNYYINPQHRGIINEIEFEKVKENIQKIRGFNIFTKVALFISVKYDPSYIEEELKAVNLVDLDNYCLSINSVQNNINSNISMIVNQRKKSLISKIVTLNKKYKILNLELNDHFPSNDIDLNLITESEIYKDLAETELSFIIKLLAESLKNLNIFNRQQQMIMLNNLIAEKLKFYRNEFSKLSNEITDLYQKNHIEMYHLKELEKSISLEDLEILKNIAQEYLEDMENKKSFKH